MINENNIFLETQPRKPRRFCRGILPQFADKILSGEKTTTIRPDAKDMQAGKLITFGNVRVEAERYSKKKNEII